MTFHQHIEFEKLVFRMLQPHDAEAVFQLFSDEKVVRFYDLERFESPDQAVRQINKWLNEFHEGTGIRWAIAESHSPENLIGTIGLQNISLLHRKAELGYDLLPIHWNRGIMGLCVQQAIRTGFEKMKLNRIEAKTDPRHLASQKVLLKNGFHLEGTLRQSVWEKGRFQDEMMFSILGQDFMA